LINPTLDPPGTPTPTQNHRSPTSSQPQESQSRDQVPLQPESASLVLAPPTPSGGLRRKSKFIAKHASRMSTRPVLYAEKIRAGMDVEVRVDTDEGEGEVEAVESGVAKFGSWMTEAFGEDEDALVGASQECAVGGSHQEVDVSACG
jgi:hypothetical protein